MDELVARAEDIGLGRSLEQIQQRVKDYDADGDGKLSMSEAKNAVRAALEDEE